MYVCVPGAGSHSGRLIACLTSCSFNFGDGRSSATYGSLSFYPDSGFDLGVAAAVAAEPAAAETSRALVQETKYASQQLNILDPRATTCGTPCQGGLRGLALAEWLDGSTRAVVLTMASYGIRGPIPPAPVLPPSPHTRPESDLTTGPLNRRA